MKLSPVQLTALRSIDAYIRVWVAWSQDPVDVKLAALFRRGAYSNRTLDALQQLGLYVPAAGPTIVGGGRAPMLTEKGKAALAASVSVPEERP